MHQGQRGGVPMDFASVQAELFHRSGDGAAGYSSSKMPASSSSSWCEHGVPCCYACSSAARAPQQQPAPSSSHYSAQAATGRRRRATASSSSAPPARPQQPLMRPSSSVGCAGFWGACLGPDIRGGPGGEAVGDELIELQDDEEDEEQHQQQQQQFATHVCGGPSSPSDHTTCSSSTLASSSLLGSSLGSTASSQMMGADMMATDWEAGLSSPEDHQDHHHHHQHAAAMEEEEEECARGPPLDPLLAEWVVGDRYRLVRLLGHGSYGQVAEAYDTRLHRKVAIKRVVNVFDNTTDARRMYRELYILRRLHHPHVVGLLDVIPPPDLEGFVDLYLVFEFVDTDLYKLTVSPQHLSNAHIEVFLYRMLLALKFLQASHVIHRDIKPANILINEDCSLKLCDFGLARVLSSPSPDEEEEDEQQAEEEEPPVPRPLPVRRHMSYDARQEEQQLQQQRAAGGRQPHASSRRGPGGAMAAAFRHQPLPKLRRQLTQHVVTRWYRAPELILLQDYSPAVDMWSLGCILGELLSMQHESVPFYQERRPLFPGRSCYPLSNDPADHSSRHHKSSLSGASCDQLAMIFDVIGTPGQEDLQCLGQSQQRYLRSLPPRAPQPLSRRLPGAEPSALDLLARMLHFNPDKRITVDQALAHPYLRDVRDLSAEQQAARAPPVADPECGQWSKQQLKQQLFREVLDGRRAAVAAAGGGHVQAAARARPTC